MLPEVYKGTNTHKYGQEKNYDEPLFQSITPSPVTRINITLSAKQARYNIDMLPQILYPAHGA